MLGGGGLCGTGREGEASESQASSKEGVSQLLEAPCPSPGPPPLQLGHTGTIWWLTKPNTKKNSGLLPWKEPRSGTRGNTVVWGGLCPTT